MLVQDVMQTKLHTVTPATTLPEALRLTSQRGVRHLPVLDGDRLVGILSDRDLKRAMASPATSLEVHELNYLLDRLRVEEIMTRTVITISRLAPIEEAAWLMVQEKIGALPVTDDGRLIGLVTETDVLRLFVRAMGAGEPSTRIDVVLDTRPHALAEAVQAIDTAGVDISSIMTLAGTNGSKEMILRVRTINPAPVIRASRRTDSWPVRPGGNDGRPRTRRDRPSLAVGFGSGSRRWPAQCPGAGGAHRPGPAAFRRQRLLRVPHHRHCGDTDRPRSPPGRRTVFRSDAGAVAAGPLCSEANPPHAQTGAERGRGERSGCIPSLAPLKILRFSEASPNVSFLTCGPLYPEGQRMTWPLRRARRHHRRRRTMVSRRG